MTTLNIRRAEMLTSAQIIWQKPPLDYCRSSSSGIDKYRMRSISPAKAHHAALPRITSFYDFVIAYRPDVRHEMKQSKRAFRLMRVKWLT